MNLKILASTLFLSMLIVGEFVNMSQMILQHADDHLELPCEDMEKEKESESEKLKNHKKFHSHFYWSGNFYKLISRCDLVPQDLTLLDQASQSLLLQPPEDK